MSRSSASSVGGTARRTVFWYDQLWDEWVLLVEGCAGLEFEGESEILELKAGDYLLIPARRRHRVAWTADRGDTIWLTVHIQGKPGHL
jgi:cupin 2 domain-containing protein